jgi:hypothetical protein
MPTREVRPKLDPETCSVCGRRLLQGEEINWFVAPDSSRHVVCELCVPRAERARWVREREGEEIVQLRPTRGERVGLFRRMTDFFAAPDVDETDSFASAPSERADQVSRREARATRRRDRKEPSVPPPPEPRDIRAIPTGAESRLEQGLELFNMSQFPRTIAGLTRSLGDPQVAAVNDSDNSIEVFVGWDIAWYSYRVSLGDATEPVEQSGRGNDTIELADRITNWNAAADGFGRLFLTEPGAASPAEAEAPEESDMPTDETPSP